IRKAHAAKGKPRKVVLVSDGAHGTNPATAVTCGYTIKAVPTNALGHVDFDAFCQVVDELSEDIAAFMLTNPSTCGLFEPDVKRIAAKLHEVGAYFYCDGANFNAIVGKVRPSDLGVDVMQFNLHKTFSTPHGGGGPGCGPVAVVESLRPYLPVPRVVHQDGAYALVTEDPHSIGRIKAFHGHFGMMVRALAYMLSHGGDGLQQVAEDAVLNANYLLARLKPHLNAPFGGGADKHEPCMHEALFDDSNLRTHGVETIDIAKALLDEGYHPMTTYFPLVVHGAMLVEPTETESKAELDRFADVMIALAKRAKGDEAASFKNAPTLAPMRRLDETRAARQPKLRWRANAPSHAAE
ncbi:MAG: aminotransferase class V-fold PLP-dependent enzyme, partial [Alphaproteobacteria bacterium]|nr:aminotransferase class V-fold PLP-dependent enzyme [Alphaproteobacteria bacterium]